jgi:hypothetical protein
MLFCSGALEQPHRPRISKITLIAGRRLRRWGGECLMLCFTVV